MNSRIQTNQIALVSMVVFGLCALAPSQARAHCDTMDGPELENHRQIHRQEGE